MFPWLNIIPSLLRKNTWALLPCVGVRPFAAPARKRQLYLLLAWLLAALAVAPVLLRLAPPPPSAFSTHLALDLGYLALALVSWRIFQIEKSRLGPRLALALVFLVILLSAVLNHIHNVNVDRAANYIQGVPNDTLQQQLHKSVLALSPGAAPHSYRFLPNAVVLSMQLAGVRFDTARDLYRALANLLLFYALYRYARLYTNFTGALIALLLAAAVYPISFENYIGQLTDPLSHLSFLLAFLFLETGDFAALLTVLLLGSLAKETVLAMAGFYALFRRQEKHHALKTAILCAASLALYFAVRLLVLHGALHYGEVSGTRPEHIFENWRDTKWRELFLLTGGAYVPFLILGWRSTPLILKKLVLYLLPVLLLSSLLFGWLAESRNYMPVTFVLAVVAGRYLVAPRPPLNPGAATNADA